MQATSKLRSPLPSPDRPLLRMRGCYYADNEYSNQFNISFAIVDIKCVNKLVEVSVYYSVVRRSTVVQLSRVFSGRRQMEVEERLKSDRMHGRHLPRKKKRSVS